MAMTSIAEKNDPDFEDVQRELDKARNDLRLYAAVVENFPGGIILTNQNLDVVVCNEQQKKLLGYSPELFDGRMPTLLELFQFNAKRGEYGPGRPEALVAAKMDLVEQRIPHVFERTRPDGSVIEVRGVPIKGGGFVTSYIDVTERRKSQEMVLKLALTDSLTGLANRAALSKYYEQFAARARRGEDFALFYIDLDDFKPVNDQYGHKTGDAVLEEVATRLKSSVRDTDVVARYGGDEFIVLQSNVESVHGIKVLARRILNNMRRSFHINEIEIQLNASVGIALCAREKLNCTMDHMMGVADGEMYKSKTLGKGLYHIEGCGRKVICCQNDGCSCEYARLVRPESPAR
jgi:diguanylate cyclase (GGDEF)-like protein